MRLKQLPDLAELLGEGFMTDEIFLKKDYKRAREYAKEIKDARLMLSSGRNLKISSLHKYVRFLTWLNFKYGEKVFKNEFEAKNFLLEKIDAIANDTPDFDSFWSWLREITLREASEVLME